MVRLNVKERGFYVGFAEWMIQYVGQRGIDWEFIIQETEMGVTVSDPKKELLVTMRWS